MITIYAADATDFGGNGLGALNPESCLVTETLNGEYEVTLVHPIDEAGKFRRLQEGRILRVPIPAGKTPRMSMSTQKETRTEIYKVTTGGMRLYLRAAPSTSSKGLATYKPGTEVVLIAKTNTQWYEVTTPDGKHGYMYAANLTYVRTETTGTAAETAVDEPTLLRDQPFRIYRIVPTLTNITVYARHIFYDLMDNMIKSYTPSASTTGAAALTGMMAEALSESDFTFYSDLDTTAEDVEITDTNPAAAILDDGGLIENYGGELARDWWDVYLARRTGEETGIQIREGKNLTGITYSVDYTNVTTRIVPRGEDADGKPLYLPESYIDSTHIGDYHNIKWALLEVKDAKEVKKGDNKRTKDECYALMRQAAQDAFDAGDDLPDVTLNVSFVDCAETEEYSQYRNLQGVHMGDTVKVIARRVGVEVAMRMTQYTYNCLTGRYETMTLGTIDDGIEGNMISPRSIGSGTISGRMIKLGSVGAGQLADGSVNSLKIALAAIQYAHIDSATVTQLTTDSLTAVKAEINRLAAGEITTDQLYADLAKIAAAQITAANIDKANINWADIKSLTTEIADIANASIGTAKIDWAKIYDLTTDTAIITEGEAGKLYIARLNVTEANMVNLTVGELMLKAADGSFKRLTVDADGNVSAETVTVEGGNIANATISGGKLIENTITARELNVESIFADTALIRAIKAANIDVSDLFAASATVSALDAYIVKASTITALKGQLDLWASDKITAAVGGVQIGGTNLVLNTDTLNAEGTVEFGTPAAGSVIVVGTFDGAAFSARNYVYITFTAGGNGANIFWHPSYSPALVDGKTYTWQIKAYIADKAEGLDVEMGLEASGLTTKHLTWGWQTFSHTFTYSVASAYKAFHLNGAFSAGDQLFLADFKIEEGDKPTAWTRNPNEIRLGTNVEMDDNNVRIATGNFDVDVPGEAGDLHIDENGLSADTATFNHINCGEVVKRVIGRDITITTPSGLQTELDRINGGMIDGSETITLMCDQYGDVTLRGIYGSNTALQITGGYAINGALTIVDCHAQKINFEGVTINCTTRAAVAIYNSAWVRLGGCAINTASAYDGVQIYGGSIVMMYNTGIYNAANALNVDWGGRLDFSNLKGTAITYLWAKGCVVTGNGSRPSGNWAGENVISNHTDMSTIAIDTGSATPAETPVTTASFTANLTGTYYPSGHWMNDNVIRQGHEGTGSNARRDYGCMWFDAGGLSGKTIKSATLTLKRIAGKGRSGTVTLKLWTTALTGKSGKPTDSLTSVGEIGAIGNGETLTVNVPVSAISAIAAGGGFVLYTEETANASGKTYSRNYAHIEGTGGSAPVLTVTHQ